jgi:hypothetical protein
MITSLREFQSNKITGANHGQTATVVGEFMLCPCLLPVVAQFRRWPFDHAIK